jgi:hypothetical protein
MAEIGWTAEAERWLRDIYEYIVTNANQIYKISHNSY